MRKRSLVVASFIVMAWLSYPVYHLAASPGSQRGRTLIHRPTACEDGGHRCEHGLGLVPTGVSGHR
jgi:hypothetical protein